MPAHIRKTGWNAIKGKIIDDVVEPFKDQTNTLVQEIGMSAQEMGTNFIDTADGYIQKVRSKVGTEDFMAELDL